ncbi:MAG: alkaline phosphatase family protein [Promethearchaeota archaeon]
MGIRTKRLLVIGIDQAIPYLLNKFIKEGVVPNIAQIAESGVMGEAYPSVPCDTPTNWTTIATGASTAIHGATSFYMHLPGESFDVALENRSRTQLSRYCKAEYFWDVADKAGYTPFVMNYPAGWPSEFMKGAMSLFTWFIPESLPRMLLPSSFYSFSIDSKNSSNGLIKVERNDISDSYSPLLEAVLYIKNKEIKRQQLIKVYFVDSQGIGYDMVKFSIVEKGRYKFLKKSEWSDWIKRDLVTNYGILPCLFRLKIIEIDPKGRSFKIQLSTIFNSKGWTIPESFGKKVIQNVFKYDLPKKKKIEFMIFGSLSKFISSAKQESLTLIESIKYAYKELKWDLCFFHYHHLDSINHNTLAYLDKKSPIYTEKQEKESWENIKKMYKIVDEMVKELINSCVDEKTVILFISDHGAIPIWKIVDIALVFAKAGLTSYNFDTKRKIFTINWKKTLAFPYMEPPFVWINLKNRDPYGIVNINEYEEVRNRVIETLKNVKDPKTNQYVIQTILKKEDASDLGLNGDRIGDLIYFLKPPYGIFDGNLNSINALNLSQNYLTKSEVNDSQKFFGAHAYYLPSAKLDKFSISAPFIISGPGIKKNLKLKNPINLIDVAPTLSQILQIPKPLNSEGRILYELLE